MSALLVAGVVHAGDSCSNRNLRAKDTVTITLDSPRHGAREHPAFYLRIREHYLVLFFKPEDLLAMLERGLFGEPARHDTRFDPVLKEIRADLPLKEDTDLFKYDLRGDGFDGLLDHVVAAMLDTGHVDVDYQPVHDPDASDGYNLSNDAFDPIALKRVYWAVSGGDGRTYCTDKGYHILSVTDTIVN